ncbi:hypothetical protein, conserved [Plasmodium ovale wallikeri]|uniref:Uncharacterized protein n=2 Tax=Plasmodium ovale TaxID=36330 RepID=A0A1A8ZXS3_PLAOA|nr:hypothetical protein, conserved [Plasmodium ovale wallikeri]SBT48676.1 hypothetical protein, conserved [Plasmodium ovale wallikeri]SBT82438.1 conserved Plasmodium protein, unknown function [Plasmodium ovale]
MNHVIIFLLLLINYGKNVIGSEVPRKDPNSNNEGEDAEVEDKWILYPLETNPFMDLQHPNFKGDFVRCIDEYYIYETKEYNAYKKERYNNMQNNKQFEKKQFQCAANLLVHGRPNSRKTQDYRIWSAQTNLIKHEAMKKKKYSKYVLYTPFVDLSNFLGTEGLYTHVNYAFLIVNRFAMTFKNMLEDDTCSSYDIFIHSHCFGANIVRLLLTLNKDIWKIFDISLINMTYERQTLSIIDDNFKLTMKDINIVTDRSHIQLRKDPYFKTSKNCLYKSFKPKLTKKKLSDHFDDVFDDSHVNYDVLDGTDHSNMKLVDSSESVLSVNMHRPASVSDMGINEEEEEEVDIEEIEDRQREEEERAKQPSNNSIRFIKRLHHYILNKKFNLLGITSTGPPLIGVVSNMEDIRVGHQKLVKYKFLLKTVPSYFKSKMLRTRDAQELIHLVNPELLCLLAIDEKLTYNYNMNRGSLISYFKNVNYYSDLDNDELMSLHTSLGLHSPLHMRSLSYYLLNFRNEYFHRTYSIPVHLSDINVSNNYPFFEYLKKNNVCSIIQNKNIEQFISYINEIVNFDQKPQPYIANRYVYKNPFLEHYVVPYMQENNVYTSHSILGTGRTSLLLYSYDIYRHIALTGFSNRNVLKNDTEFIYDSDPLIFYNWLTHIGNQNYMTYDNFMQDVYVYSDNINMNIVRNLFNIFISSHYVKFFIFSKNNTADIYRSLYRTLRSFSIPTVKVVLKRQKRKPINYPLLRNTEFDYEENVLYEYIRKYTNFLQNYIYNNSYYYTTNDTYLLNHKMFKKHHKEHIDDLKKELKKINSFVKENKTFSEMRNKLAFMYNIENTTNSNDRENDVNEELGDINTVESSYPLDYSSSSDSNSSSTIPHVGRTYVRHHGIYLHIKRSLTLKKAFKSIIEYNTAYNNIQYIEFVLKNATHENIEDHLNNMDSVNSCLFTKDEKIDLTYISKYCNYDQQSYFHLKKRYNTRKLYVVKSLSDCSNPKYSHLKLCENSILLKKFFGKDLDVVLSELHEKERERMIDMRNAIEREIHKTDILGISNDSLVALFHNKNDDITSFKINACFNLSKGSVIQSLFQRGTSRNNAVSSSGNSDVSGGTPAEEPEEGSPYPVYCTQVTLPVLLNGSIMKSINDIYLRAIRSIMQLNSFRKIFNIPADEDPYDSFVYFFDKFAYIYELRNKYERAKNIRTFTTPQTIKWNYFYYLLKHDIKTDYNNETFLQDFFYGEKDDLVKPVRENLLKDFLNHFTVFFYLFKVD